MANVGIIGGADGPTVIFVTSALPRMLNPWGMAIILLMMIPNVIFALRHRNMENRCKSRFINILEQIGRYGCLILMIICIGLDKFGFGSVEDFLIYLFGSALLLLAYFIFWILYGRSPSRKKALALAIIPCCLFLLCGVTLRQWPLVVFSMLFCVGHICVTLSNNPK